MLCNKSNIFFEWNNQILNLRSIISIKKICTEISIKYYFIFERIIQLIVCFAYKKKKNKKLYANFYIF